MIAASDSIRSAGLVDHNLVVERTPSSAAGARPKSGKDRDARLIPRGRTQAAKSGPATSARDDINHPVHKDSVVESPGPLHIAADVHRPHTISHNSRMAIA